MSTELASAGPISAYDGSPLIILIPGFDNISKAAELGCSGKAAHHFVPSMLTEQPDGGLEARVIPAAWHGAILLPTEGSDQACILIHRAPRQRPDLPLCGRGADDC
jgi:hypothetical protein